MLSPNLSYGPKVYGPYWVSLKVGFIFKGTTVYVMDGHGDIIYSIGPC